MTSQSENHTYANLEMRVSIEILIRNRESKADILS